MSSVSWGLPPRGGSGRNNTTLTRIVVVVVVVAAAAALARSLPGVKVCCGRPPSRAVTSVRRRRRRTHLHTRAGAEYYYKYTRAACVCACARVSTACDVQQVGMRKVKKKGLTDPNATSDDDDVLEGDRAGSGRRLPYMYIILHITPTHRRDNSPYT
ncbi:unnamed protein product [Aphis gossypii]|uniref:Uncharacterized protein n=1 Tax=Aphis gossypii TaxID=80765 RepID=A0A9P0JBS2_APHGO|nr:unnamed protein product [Aphis gossypii]